MPRRPCSSVDVPEVLSIRAIAACGKWEEISKVEVERVDFGHFSKSKLVAGAKPQILHDGAQLGVSPQINHFRIKANAAPNSNGRATHCLFHASRRQVDWRCWFASC